MDNNSIHFEQPFHNLYLKDRKSLELTGIKSIESFDSIEFLIETSLGFLNITGGNLALARYDQDKGEVSIKGTIDSIRYIVSKKNTSKNKETMFNKLMK